VDNRRTTTRLSKDEIPEFLQNPILLYNYEEVKSNIENLTPIGIGLSIDKEIIIDKGEAFLLKYYCFDTDIKCVCVFSDVEGNCRKIGAYFSDPEHQKLIYNHLFF
jgi:hypothetical protein